MSGSSGQNSAPNISARVAGHALIVGVRLAVPRRFGRAVVANKRVRRAVPLQHWVQGSMQKFPSGSALRATAILPIPVLGHRAGLVTGAQGGVLGACLRRSHRPRYFRFLYMTFCRNLAIAPLQSSFLLVFNKLKLKHWWKQWPKFCSTTNSGSYSLSLFCRDLALATQTFKLRYSQ